MSLIVLTLVSSLSWVPIADKQALICPLSALNKCLDTLPASVRTQLPDTLEQFKRDIGFRSAMVIPVDDSHFSGLILVNKQETPQIEVVNIDGVTYQLDLREQSLLTLWHELGHLENIALQGSILPNDLSTYQHESLADIYLIWRIARENNNFALAWQQYHRRNLAALTNAHNMSHWSAPMMIQVLNKCSPAQVGQYARYRDFLADFYPKIDQLEPRTLNEFSSLIQRTFGGSVLQSLPEYLFWRKSELGLYLKPTFILLMGEEKAHDWLVQNSML